MSWILPNYKLIPYYVLYFFISETTGDVKKDPKFVVCRKSVNLRVVPFKYVQYICLQIALYVCLRTHLLQCWNLQSKWYNRYTFRWNLLILKHDTFLNTEFYRSVYSIAGKPGIDRSTKPVSLLSPSTHSRLGPRTLIIPSNVFIKFLTIAQNNTDKNLETCGLLTGKLVSLLFYKLMILYVGCVMCKLQFQ